MWTLPDGNEFVKFLQLGPIHAVDEVRGQMGTHMPKKDGAIGRLIALRCIENGC
jgi:hypothetical protein